MSEEYKNMDYYQLYEYIEGLRIELEEAQASTEFQGKIADDLRKQLEDSNKDLQETMHGFVLQGEAFIELKPKYDALRKQLKVAVKAIIEAQDKLNKYNS